MPEWGDWILDRLEDAKRVDTLSGFGCNPVAIRVTRDELLGWLEEGVRSKDLIFPSKNGPIFWPELKAAASLRPQQQFSAAA